jgi:Carboxypeptidase regulatory-like domain
MWRTATIAVLGAVALSAQAPLRPTPQAPPRDTRLLRPASPGSTAPINGVIRGRVVTDRADAPLPIVKARVVVAGAISEVEPFFTDSLGRFEFSLPPGHYTISAEKTGFAATRYGAATLFDPLVPIDLQSGATEEIEIRMPKGAAVFGRIIDDLGDPVVGARVSAGVVWMEGLNRRLQSVSRTPAVTDDLGEYRIGGLPPGRYLLSVAAPSAFAVTIASFDVDSPPARRIGWGKTFYPSGSSSAGATPIDLATGEEHGGVDVTLVPFRPARLSVSISGGATPAPGTMINTTLRFIPANEPDSESAAPGQGLGFNSTSFANVPSPPVNIDPGEWIVVARRNAIGAIAHISLSSGDEASLVLPLQPGARLTGRVLFEGSTRHPPPTSVHIDVIGAGPDVGVSPLLLAPGGPFAVRPDGAFEITGVIGTVELAVADPMGWAVKNIKAGDRDLLGASLTLSGTELLEGLELVLTDQVADLSGSIVNSVPGCKVAVFPAADDAAFNARRMRLTSPDKRGQFFIEDLPPGAYFAIARPDINPADWTMPLAVNRFRESATPFSIASREKKTLTLECLSIR